MATIHELPAYGYRMFLKEPSIKTLAANGVNVDSHGFVFERTTTGVQLVRRPDTPPTHDFSRVTIRGKDAQWIPSASGETKGAFVFYSTVQGKSSGYTAIVHRDGSVHWLKDGRNDKELGMGFDASGGVVGDVHELTYVTYRPAREPAQKYEERSWKSDEATRDLLVKVL